MVGGELKGYDRLLTFEATTKVRVVSETFHGIRASSAEDALGIAAANGALTEIELLLDDGVDVDALASYSKSTALASAAGQGRAKAVDLLLERGANVDLPGANDMTPLMHSCSLGKSKGTKVGLQLIEAGADVNYVRKADGMTALMFAVHDCKPELIQALIEHGAEVDGPASTSQTPLMIAARANHVPALEVLVANGADLTRPCGLPWAESRTALGLAQLEKRRKAVEFLESLS